MIATLILLTTWEDDGLPCASPKMASKTRGAEAVDYAQLFKPLTCDDAPVCGERASPKRALCFLARRTTPELYSISYSGEAPGVAGVATWGSRPGFGYRTSSSGSRGQ